MSNNKALKSGIWYTVANFLIRSIGLITTPIFTRLLSHEEFGLYNNFISWLNIFTILVTLNLDSTFISAKYDFEDDFDGYIFSALALSSTSCIIAMGVLNLLYSSIYSILGMDRIYLNAMLVYLLFLPAINMFQARERYFYKYKISIFLSLLIAIGTALLSVLLVIRLKDKLEGRIYGSIFPSIIIGLILYVIIHKYGRKINTAYWKYAIKICLPYIPHLLSMTILNSVDRIMITNVCGAEDNALYSLAYSCGSIISILIVSLNTAFGPWLGEKLYAIKYNEINRFSQKYISIFIVLAIGVMIFTPEVLLILGGRSYLNAIFIMPPIACGCICQFLYTMFVNVEQFSKKTIGMAIASASAALLNYILNLIFIPRYGYIAAAYTTLAGFLWLLIIHMYLVYRYGLKQVYPYRFIGITVVLTVVATIGINLLYGYNTIRYFVGIAYSISLCVYVVKNRNYIVNALRKKNNLLGD